MVFFHVFYFHLAHFEILGYNFYPFLWTCFCSRLLLSKRTLFSLFSYFLQCCMWFLLHCTFLHKFSLLKLLGRIGQDSYSIFMTWEILLWLFLQKDQNTFWDLLPFLSLLLLSGLVLYFALILNSLLNLHCSLSCLSFVCVSV